MFAASCFITRFARHTILRRSPKIAASWPMLRTTQTTHGKRQSGRRTRTTSRRGEEVEIVVKDSVLRRDWGRRAVRGRGARLRREPAKERGGPRRPREDHPGRAAG